MLKIVLALAATVVVAAHGLIPTSPAAQPGERAGQVDPTFEAMRKLDFLMGEWEGTATFTAAGGQIRGIRQTESVQRKIKGKVLLVEGIGRATPPGQDERVVFEALATISFDPQAGAYTMRAYGSDGQVDPKVEVGDRELVWSFTTVAGNSLRYTVRVDERGHWMEKGERLFGADWAPFLEMELVRKPQNEG